MKWKDSRLNNRLSLKPSIVEEVYSILSEIDSVKNSWIITKKLLPQTIQRLTHSVIVTSTGSSNRIEGNKLSDNEIEKLYKNLNIKKLKNRDEQEVVGYLKVLEVIFNQYDNIQINESSILQLHKDMLQHSQKDFYHRGQYKSNSNRVEAKDQSGNIVGVIFDPTPPYLVKKEMQELVSWYHQATENQYRHQLILIANFIFEYLAIHPFQDGNGRTSRLVTNIMLLKSGYSFASIVSGEKLVEENKAEYYLALNKTQTTWKQKKEDISSWLLFFLKIIQKQAQKTFKLIESEDIEHKLSEKQLSLWNWALQLPKKQFSRKDAIEALGFPPRTIESIIKKLFNMKKLDRLGEGRATRYRVL
jgi:Fic family protein